MGSKSSSSNKTSNKAFNFNNVDYGQGDSGGGGGLAKNINLAESSLEIGDVISTDHGAVSGSLDFAAGAARENAALTLALGDRAFDDVEDSRELTRSLFTTGTESVTEANREALQFLGQRTDRALAFAQQATRSEAGTIAENLTKYMFIGGAVLAGLFILPKLKG